MGKRRNKYDSSSETSRRRKKSKNKKRRKRRLKSNDDDDEYDKCTDGTLNGWGHRRRRRMSDCNENIVERVWYDNHWKDSDDDDDDDNDLNQICLFYQVNAFENTDCGELDALFLPLCNDTNSENVKSNELDAIITKISPNILSAHGVELFDSVGILIRFYAEIVNEFVLCLSNVSIHQNYFQNDDKKITVANWAAFQINNVFEECLNNDGLPCLNFVFPSKCENDSDSDSDSSEEQILIKENNALINYNLLQDIKSKTYWQLNGKWKTEIIIIISVLIALIIITLMYLMYTAKLYKKYQNEPKITKLSDKNYRKMKRKRLRKKRKNKNGLMAVESETDYETDDHEQHE